jgi:hypothetical protein
MLSASSCAGESFLVLRVFVVVVVFVVVFVRGSRWRRRHNRAPGRAIRSRAFDLMRSASPREEPRFAGEPVRGPDLRDLLAQEGADGVGAVAASGHGRMIDRTSDRTEPEPAVCA